MSPTIAFDGGYTIWSAGDDAPLAFLADRLRRSLGSDVRLRVLARHPNAEFDRHYGVETVPNLEYPSKALSQGKWFRGLNFSDNRRELRELAEALTDVDLLILGAGNFITETSLDIMRGHFSRFALMTLLADINSIPVYFFGLSANRLRNPWVVKTASWMLSRAAAVTFRDHAAVRNLTDSGVSLPPHVVLPDPVLGAPSQGRPRAAEILTLEGIPGKKRARLALAVRDMSWRKAHAGYEDLLVKVLDAWCAVDERDVVCIPQCTYNVDTSVTDDRFIAARLRDRLRRPDRMYLIEGRYPSWDIEACYCESDIALATRLHGSVFAAKQGVPPIGIAYEDKVFGFYEQMEMQEWCVGLDVAPETLSSMLALALKQRETLSIKMRSRIQKLQKELNRYAEIALALLQKTTSA